MRVRLFLSGALVLALVTTSCSSGPAPPRPGTPGFYWAGAIQAFRAGDFQKTDTNLVEISRTDNEFAARARAWDMVLSAGLAEGYSQLADNFEAGAKANRANPMPFHKQVTNLRSFASSATLELAQATHTFMEKDKDPNVVLAFEYPIGSAMEPGSLKKVAGGILIQDSERDSLQAAMLQRGVLLSACRATGSGDDSAKAAEKFKAGEVRVPREAFLLVVAKALYDQADLFGSKKLDNPNRLKVVCQQALEAVQAVPETKETKALAAKIQSSLKKLKT